jgi:hypothetical protein
MAMNWCFSGDISSLLFKQNILFLEKEKIIKTSTTFCKKKILIRKILIHMEVMHLF